MNTTSFLLSWREERRKKEKLISYLVSNGKRRKKEKLISYLKSNGKFAAKTPLYIYSKRNATDRVTSFWFNVHLTVQECWRKIPTKYEVEWPGKTEFRKAGFLALGAACKAIKSVLYLSLKKEKKKGGTLHVSEFSSTGDLNFCIRGTPLRKKNWEEKDWFTDSWYFTPSQPRRKKEEEEDGAGQD